MNVTLQFEPANSFVPAPRVPITIEQTGLDPELLLDLLLKVMVKNALVRASEIAAVICLPVRIIEELLDEARRRNLVETVGLEGNRLSSELRFVVTGKGRNWTDAAIANCDWAGPAPVTLQSFLAQAQVQTIRSELMTRDMLDQAFHDLTLPEELMAQLGPAANSGASILLYGPPGNGKTSLALAIGKAYRQRVFLPHAIAVENQIITLFDPTVHRPVAVQEAPQGGLRRNDAHDQRYVLCERPAIVAGGELTLDLLDLRFDTKRRIYEAPLQLKALGGVLIVDDFGRQSVAPQQIVNRLIIPLESRTDYLALATGRKFETLFDLLMIFSTNKNPGELLDEAGLRRLRNKILVDRPSIETFIRIFVRAAKANHLVLDEHILAFVLYDLYGANPWAKPCSFHPKFLIEQVISIATYEGVRPRLSPDYLRRAWANLFPTREPA